MGEEVEIIAFGAVRFDVILDGGAAGVKGICHGFANTSEDLGRFGFGDTTDTAGGMNAGEEKGFIGVNIADASDGGLVEKGGFNSGGGVFLETTMKFGRREI